MSEKARVPKNGAGRRLAEKLKELGQEDPEFALFKHQKDNEE